MASERVLVGADAGQVALQFLTAARQFGAAVVGISTSSAALADQAAWSGAAAERFQADRQAMAPHLRATGASILRMAAGALAVIQAIDRADALGGSAGVPGPVSTAVAPASSAGGSVQVATFLAASGAGGQNNSDLGAQIGTDLGQMLLGAGLIALGTGGEILGFGLDATGAGAVLGVPANVVSAGVIASGAGLVAHGALDLSQRVAAMTSSGSGGGGSGSGGQRSGSPKTRQEIAAQANKLGYNKRIPAQKAPFDSHGQVVYSDGDNYITPDVDSHNVTNGWKMFNRRGQRVGTYDWDLTTRMKN
jgi:hypothetical protein